MLANGLILIQNDDCVSRHLLSFSSALLQYCRLAVGLNRPPCKAGPRRAKIRARARRIYGVSTLLLMRSAFRLHFTA